MSGTEKKSRVLGFGLSNPEKQQEGGAGTGGRGKMEHSRDGSEEIQDRPYTSSFEDDSQANRNNQSRRELENKRQRRKEFEEGHEKTASSVQVQAAMSEESKQSSSSPHRAYLYQQQQQQHSGKSEGVARPFAAKGRTVNEVELGPSSYSHYPTSDTRTEEGEASYETSSLTGPGLSNRGSSATRGRIWETETTYDDGRKGQNRAGGSRDFDFMHPPSTLVSTSASTSTSTSTTSTSPASFAQDKDKEPVYLSSSSSPKRTSRSAAELSVLPVSQTRESKEDHSYTSYPSTSAIAIIHRSREDGLIAGPSTSSKPSNTLPSISRVEENSSTPSVPRARNESVSGSSSASALTHVPTYRVPQNQHSSESFMTRSPSPSNISGDYRDREHRQKQSWVGGAQASGGSTTPIMMSSSTRGSYRRDEASRARTPERMGPSSGAAEDPIHHSHVSRSPDRSYFQNTSATRSGNSSTNATLLGTMAYQRQQELAKEPSHNYSEAPTYSSDHPNHRTQSPLPPPLTYGRPRSRGPADRVGTYPSSARLASFDRQQIPRGKQDSQESRSHGRSTSSTPPSSENRDTLRQRSYTSEYQRPESSRQDDSRRLSTQEQNRHENIMTESTHSSSSSAGRFGILKGVRVQNTNPPSKATSSYSTPSTTSISLSPALEKTLPSLRETLASPTITSESLPQPRGGAGSSSMRPRTVSIPPAQTISRSAPGGPWLYDGEEPDLEEDDGFAVADEGGRPKKRRRTRVALSCAECKRRKIKCDRAQPCTPCARRGDQSNCKWAVMETKDGAPTRAEFENLQTRVSRLEQLLSSVAPQLTQNPQN